MQLQEETKELVGIIITAQESFRILSVLVKAESDDDRTYEKNINSFFVFTRDMSWRNVIIELAKLYTDSDNEHFNLLKFLRKFQPGNQYSHVPINPAIIANWESLIAAESAAIQNIITQRQKLYAHRDRTAHSIVNTVRLNQVMKLIDLAASIIREIYIVAFQQSTNLGDLINSPAENLDSIISRLASENRYRRTGWKRKVS